MNKVLSNLSLHSLCYAEACNELAGPISTSLRPDNTASFEEMSQWWRAVGNTVFDLTVPRLEPQTSRCRDKRVTARPTGRYNKVLLYCNYVLCIIIPTKLHWQKTAKWPFDLRVKKLPPAICQSHGVEVSHFFFNGERQARSCDTKFCSLRFEPTRIKPESTISVVDTSTRLLIDSTCLDHSITETLLRSIYKLLKSAGINSFLP